MGAFRVLEREVGGDVLNRPVRWVRVLLFALTFLAVASLGGSPLFALAFPWGIPMLFLGGTMKPSWLANILYAGGWAGYSCLAGFGSAARSRRRFLVLYAGFVLLLFVNLAGCARGLRS